MIRATRPHKPASCRQTTMRGFSLIELLVVIAIIGIAMAVAMPGLRTLMDTQKMKSATFDLVTTVMQARSEAIKFGTTSGASISIVPSSAGSGTTYSGTRLFTNGWCITFTSGSSCNVTSANPGADVMRMNLPIANVNYVVTTCTTTSTSSCVITFGRNGRLSSGTAVKIQLTNDDAANPLTRCVTIDSSGNANTKVAACT